MNGKIIQHIEEKLTLINGLTNDVAELLKSLDFKEPVDPTEPIPDPADALEIVDLVDQLPVNKGSRWYPYRNRDLNLLTHHVIHHTAVNRDSLPIDIAHYHANVQNWPGAAYTFYINWDGTITRMNHTKTMGFAVYKMNHVYLSTCLAGAFISGRKPTDAQIRSARWLHNVQIPNELGRKLELMGHKDAPHNKTSCPGNNSKEWLALIAEPFES